MTSISDTVDTTTVSLSATGSITEAGGTITYTANVDNPIDTAMTVTLSNGETITIAAGNSSGTVDVAVAADEDVYVDADSISTTIASTSGGNFENVAIDATPAVTTVSDTVDTTTVSLSATSSITEAGGTITYIANVDNPTDTAMTVTLSNGETITIAAGDSSGTVDVAVAADEDVYVDADSISTTITSTSGGNFESVAIDSTPAVTTVSDTLDITTVSLSATSSITEAGGTITYTSNVDNPTDTAMTVTLSNGETITIAAGDSSGTVDVAVAADEDVYADGSSLSATIASTSGGNFEAVSIDSTPAVTNVTDTVDTTTVSLSATGSITEAGGTITYTANVDNPTDTAMTVTLSNGETVTIEAGDSSGTVDVAVAADEDVYAEGSSISTTISSTSGGNFETVSIDSTPAVTTVSDTIDTTTVSLSSTGSVTDTGGNIIYTAVVDNVPDTDLNVVLDNGETIVISAEDTSGSVTVTFNSTELIGVNEVNAAISSTTGGNYENLNVDGSPASTNVIDTTAPTIAFNAIATDNVVDDTEDNSVVIGGTTTGVEDGQTITISVDGTDYSTLVNGNTWALTAIDMSGFKDGTVFSVTADVSDAAGNNAQASTSFSNVNNTSDDVAIVHESALSDGSGKAETLFDNNDEASQNPNQGVELATGNLLANDVGASSVTSINGTNPDGNGVITVNGANGQLVVNASTGDYTYTLTSAATNDPVANDDSVVENFSFTYNLGVSADLSVTVVDDAPVATSSTIEVAQTEMNSFSIMLMLDVSTSMTNGDGLVYFPDGSTATRLDIAKQSLIALGQEYFQQSTDIEIKVGVFAGDSYILNNGDSFDNFADFENTVSTITDAAGDSNISDGTNYESALNTMQSNFTIDSTGSNISYFLSDGNINQGNTDLAASTNWVTFANSNDIESFAAGIGTGLTNFSDLDYIHNIDSNADGVQDSSLLVPDLTELGSVLLSTVPVTYGGTVVSTNDSASAVFGADGGFIQSIVVMLDTDGDAGTPDQAVTFVFDPNANSALGGITNDASIVSSSGTALTLTGAEGFRSGSLIFDFSDGVYNYFMGVGVIEGDSFDLGYTLADGDGDTSSTETLTVTVVNGVPIANDDTHTIKANETSAIGNVISGIGTDGGVSLSSSFTTFTVQGDGVDVALDNAVVTAIDYRGDNIFLTNNVSNQTATASDGSQYTYSVAGGVLSLTNNDGSALEFHQSGYYNYTPANAPVAQTGATVVEDFSDGATGNGVIVSAGLGATLTYNGANGLGVSGGTGRYGDSADRGELLEIVFDPAQYAYGVQNVVFDFGYDSGSGTLRIFSIDGTEAGTVTLTGSDIQTVPIDFSNIGRITLQAGSSGDYSIQDLTFDPITLDTTTPASGNELIGYTLTDDDNTSSEATLNISATQNLIAGTEAGETTVFTDLNDRVVGFGGDDIISGGLGADILEGGAGADILSGDEGDDLLSGGIGMDILSGGDGDDTLKGGEDNDILSGNDDNDKLLGGSGSDNLFGGSGDDSLMGGDGIDFLYGGSGNDLLEGGAGRDTFVWQSGDEGSVLAPTLDTISDFSAVAGGDKLDLSNLLQGEENGSLTEYLHFDSDGNGGTTVSVDVDGGGSFETSQQINLVNVDLTAGGTLSDQDIINNLLANENINFD